MSEILTEALLHRVHERTIERPEAREEFSGVVEELCSGRRKVKHSQPLPSRDVIVKIVEDLRSVIFPGYFGTTELSVESMRYYVGSALDRLSRDLREQIRRGLCFTCQCQDDSVRCLQCDEDARQITSEFILRLPAIRRMLEKDVEAAYRGDPAATSPDEAIFCYPGILAITNNRLAHELHHLHVPLIPRMITEYAHSITGIDIHHGAHIEEGFFIDHGTGVVIGETCIIGKGVRIYQGVTLGAKSFPADEEGKLIKGIDRHPIVEDDVVIYSGATILGRITIGAGSVIGGNVWLTHSVPPGSRISQAQIRENHFDQGAGI